MFFIEPISIICAVIGLLLGMIVGIFYRKRIAEAKVGVAEDRANKIVDEAVKDAEARKKEARLHPIFQSKSYAERAKRYTEIER